MANGQPFAVVSEPIRRQNVTFSDLSGFEPRERSGATLGDERVANGQPFAVVFDPIRRQNVTVSESLERPQHGCLCREGGGRATVCRRCGSNIRVLFVHDGCFLFQMLHRFSWHGLVG